MSTPHERDHERERRNYYTRSPLFSMNDPVVHFVLWAVLSTPFIFLMGSALVRDLEGDPNAHWWGVGACAYLIVVIIMIPVVGWTKDEFFS